MSGNTIYPKVAVLCISSGGSPELHTCTPAVTHEQMINGAHYDLAKENAAYAGIDHPMIAFDATDSAARQLAETASWFHGQDALRAAQTTVAPTTPAGRSELHGNVQAAVSATNLLRDAWRAAIEAGAEGNLIRDVDLLVESLAGFRRHALETLPVKNGGLGGRPKQEWLDELAALDVSVCSVEEVPADGFWQVIGGWRVDDLYGSEEEAVSAAVRLNLERSIWDRDCAVSQTRETPRAR